MFKKYLTVILAVFVINLSLSVAAFAGTGGEKEAKFAEKVKANVTKLDTGKDARVEVKLKDGTKLKGYVCQINESSFVVMDENTATPTKVPYPQAKQIKGNNLSKGVKIAIGIGIVVIVLIILGLATRSA